MNVQLENIFTDINNTLRGILQYPPNMKLYTMMKERLGKDFGLTGPLITFVIYVTLFNYEGIVEINDSIFEIYNTNIDKIREKNRIKKLINSIIELISTELEDNRIDSWDFIEFLYNKQLRHLQFSNINVRTQQKGYLDFFFEQAFESHPF